MNHKARKRFGQNFLQDQTIIDAILATIEVQAGEHWVEIGPGMGAITAPLLQKKAQLDVVELDRDLVIFLQNKFHSLDGLTIHSADALTFDFSSLYQPPQKLRIIGNLPYNISTPLLFHLLANSHVIEDMHFMLQKEVVNRICANPGNKQYGRLTVMLNYYCQTEWVMDVAPESFNPIPQVNSAIVKLTPHRSPVVEVNDVGQLNQVVIAAFSQRRKTIRNSLKKLISEQQICESGIDPSVRAESISLVDFAKLSGLLKN